MKATFVLSESDYTNEGRILVGGTFKAEKVQRDEDNVEDNGSQNAQIIWKKSSVDEAKEKYVTALDRMVQAWILKNSTEAWSDVNAYGSDSWLTNDRATVLDDKASWVELSDAAYEAYKAWAEVDKEIEPYGKKNGWFNQEFKKDANGLVAAAIKVYTDYGTDNKAAAIKAAYPDNSWVNATVYTNAVGADATLSEITTTPNGSIDAAFLTKIKDIAENSIKVSAEKDKVDLNAAKNKAIWLSLQGLEVKDVDAAWLPDGSYINVYETSTEYIVMDALKKKTANFGTWFETYKGNSNANFKTIDGIQKAMAAIKDVYDGNKDVDDYSYVKSEITKSGLYDYVDDVLNWEYNNDQIDKLYNEVN